MTPESFITTNAALMAPSLVPEIKLYLATEVVPLWRATEDELEKMGVPPPYWAFAWAGGQALARYVLDNASIVTDLRVLDLASGLRRYRCGHGFIEGIQQRQSFGAAAHTSTAARNSG